MDPAVSVNGPCCAQQKTAEWVVVFKVRVFLHCSLCARCYTYIAKLTLHVVFDSGACCGNRSMHDSTVQHPMLTKVRQCSARPDAAAAFIEHIFSHDLSHVSIIQQSWDMSTVTALPAESLQSCSKTCHQPLLVWTKCSTAPSLLLLSLKSHAAVLWNVRALLQSTVLHLLGQTLVITSPHCSVSMAQTSGRHEQDPMVANAQEAGCCHQSAIKWRLFGW